MPRRGWDDPWRTYPASVPLPAEGGVATSKQRGPMAATWWSRRFVEVLESYGLGARMQRGRRYARGGQVLGIEVDSAVIAAQVQGSRRTPYLVTVSLPEPTAQQWEAIDRAMAAKVGFVAHLLAGDVPPELEAVFRSAGVALFPDAWPELRSRCSCPDWENPCKHIAAVLYVFADQLDADPWLVLAWRGRTRDEVLDRLRGGSAAVAASSTVAPWWPFADGPLPDLAVVTPSAASVAAPEPAGGVLDALAPLAVQFGAVPAADLLATVYPSIVAPPAPDS